MYSDVLNPNLIDLLVKKKSCLSLSMKITHAFMSKINREIKSKQLDLEEWIILSLLNNGSAIYATELSQVMQLSAPRLTRIICELERKELITRQTEENDRRKIRLVLSEKGNLLCKRLNQAYLFDFSADESKFLDQEKKFITAVCELYL